MGEIEAGVSRTAIARELVQVMLGDAKTKLLSLGNDVINQPGEYAADGTVTTPSGLDECLYLLDREYGTKKKGEMMKGLRVLGVTSYEGGCENRFRKYSKETNRRLAFRISLSTK